MIIRKYEIDDSKEVMAIWNAVIRNGNAFMREEELTMDNVDTFFLHQSYTGVAVDETSNEIVGAYILHPNFTGHCSHICNASYAVKDNRRGQHIGERLIVDSMKVGAKLGFRILQFNAVVASNIHALHLYKRLGFTQLGRIPSGYRKQNGHYEDIIPHYIELNGYTIL